MSWSWQTGRATKRERGSGAVGIGCDREIAADAASFLRLRSMLLSLGASSTPMLNVVAGVFVGAVCGSFAALVADRVPRGEFVVSGRSRCRACSCTLTAIDLIPVVSWVVLRGRCRMCSTRIGPLSTIIEVSTAVLFGVCALRFRDPFVLGAHWVLCTGLMALSVIDFRTFRLPRRIVHTTFLWGALLLCAASLWSDRVDRMYTAFIGAGSALGAMALLYIVSRGRLGDGYVRLSPLLGMFLGWKDGSAVFAGFLLAFHLGAVAGLGAICARRMTRSSAIPFGPFLALGTLVTVLFDVHHLLAF